MIKLKLEFSLLLLLSAFSVFGQDELPCNIQPSDGPGSSNYAYEKVKMLDFATLVEGAWVMYPEETQEKELNLIVFVHGYGAINPMIFGAWIKHLVRNGNVVVYPRYQKTLINPFPTLFAEYVAKGINIGIDSFQLQTGIELNLENVSFIGHSYGGAIVTYLANYYEKYEIPKPKSLFACEPGTGPFNDAKLRSYRELEEDIQLLVMVGNEDLTVGDELGLRIYLSSKQLKRRNFIRQYSDVFEDNIISSSHYEPYALDMEFDTGDRNFTAERALKVGKIDAIDYYGYWKLYDSLLDCSRNNQNCGIAFGDTDAQKYLGHWNDQIPVRPLSVYDPSSKPMEMEDADFSEE